MPRVSHFEIYADNINRAINFYSSVFGWEIKKWEGPLEYYLITTGKEGEAGIDGGMMARKEPVKCDSIVAYVCTINVPNIDEYVSKVVSHGGLLVLEKATIPAVGYFAYCKDTEGNIFGIMQDDPKAA